MAPQRFHEQFEQIQRSMPDVPLAMGPDDSAEFIYEKGYVLVRDGEDAALVEDTVRAHFTAEPELVQDHVRRAGQSTTHSRTPHIPADHTREGDQGPYLH
ncbi:peptidase S8, partial [Streptomyces nigra]